MVAVIGFGLTAWTWHGAMTREQYGFKAAMFGPVAAVLGIGMLSHGAEIPLDGITRVTRIWGVADRLQASSTCTCWVSSSEHTGLRQPATWILRFRS